MSLFRAETRRLGKRRFTKVMVVGCLLVLAAIAIGMFVTNQKVGRAEVARAQARAEQDYEQAVRDTDQQRQQCQAAHGTPEAPNFPPDCLGITPPSPEDFDYQWYMPGTFDFHKGFPEMVTVLAAILAVGAFVVGASFVGAEWTSGGMMNLLLWRPQRIRVLGTKLAALLAGTAALAVVASLVWTMVFQLIAVLRGSTAGMTAGSWLSLALLEVRALVLVLVAAALGFALASLGRHTAMAMGVVVGVIVLFQFGLATVLAVADVKFAELYLIPVWTEAWLNKQVKLEHYNACSSAVGQFCRPETLTITWQMAGGVFVAVVALVVGAAMWTIRSRDVT
ncbi:ABC transporter permease subunit [Krasilnikovia sp. MM14-A1259]|uniref:ABC transporter permease subunit n=1 Tax=Krasilnikovia sp. MM14-A1259 TaxID=3373539 RepID=UPI0038285F2A